MFKKLYLPKKPQIINIVHQNNQTINPINLITKIQLVK